jgi:GNAT superfamily N-acetyltransferase
VADPLLEHPRALAEKVARVLAGRTVNRADLAGFVSSDFDPFLNHLFAAGKLAPRDAARVLDGRPGFVWLDDGSAAGEVLGPDAGRALLLVMQGMVTDISRPAAATAVRGEIAEVRSAADLEAWHSVYCEVFGANPRSQTDWRRVHGALGPSGDGSLLLLLARVEGRPAGTGGVFFDQGAAGLYCFTTRESMRGRGLASALVHASHAAARARGFEQALLHATPAGRPIYARASYREERALPVLRFPVEGARTDRGTPS